jgi:hypothetical protein
MTVSPAEIYNLILTALQRLQDDGGQFQRAIAKKQLSDLEFWLLSRLRYFSASVTPGDFQTYGPYTSVANYEHSLESLAARGLVEKVETNRYRSAEAGRKLIEKLYHAYFSRIAKHDFLPPAEIRRLSALADRVLNSALHQPNLPTPITEATFSVFPSSEEIWVLAERRIVALSAFRDDSHIAAWRDEGWSGSEVGLSTALFQSADGLDHDQLRAAAVALNDKDFKSALSALYSGGEISSTHDHYRLSAAGQTSRQKIEDLTNRNYSLPFNALESVELDEMIGLLEKTRGPQSS